MYSAPLNIAQPKPETTSVVVTYTGNNLKCLFSFQICLRKSK